MNQLQKTLIIIVTYNGVRWIREVLDAIGTDSSFDVWVRDNGSTDETMQVVKNHPATAFISQGDNIGFGRANNEGLRFALANGYDSVFLQNQDCRCDLGMFHQLRSMGLQNPQNVTCPVQLNWDGKGANFNFQERYFPDWNSTTEPREVSFVNAAAWFIPISLVRTIGGFNPVFFMYGEDRDWARRLLKCGGRFTVLPDVWCFHDSTIQGNPENLLRTNRNIIHSFETTEYFFSCSSFDEWNSGWLRRSVKRCFKRKQLYNTAILVNPIAEFLVYQQIKKARSKLEEVRLQARYISPFLVDE